MKPDLNVLALVIIIVWGLWGFFYKYGVTKLGLLPAIFATNVVYTIGNIIILVYLYNKGITFPIEGTTALLGLGTILGIIGSLLFMYALENFPGSTIIPLTALYPAFSSVLIIIVLKEQVSAMNAIGIGLAVVAGYFLTR